jgi:hypothetical protein
MNTTSTQTGDNQVQFNYNRQHKGWNFVVPDNGSIRTIIVKCGGRETAEKVANVLKGSLKRTQGRGIDNLARANISQIVGTF